MRCRILSSAPFIPFVVIFCHTIQAREPDGLANLQAVVELQELLPTQFLDIYGNQLRLFKLMYDVARDYINMMTSAGNVGGHEIHPTPLTMFLEEANSTQPRNQFNDSSHVSTVSEYAVRSLTFITATASIPERFRRYGQQHGNWPMVRSKQRNIPNDRSRVSVASVGSKRVDVVRFVAQRSQKLPDHSTHTIAPRYLRSRAVDASRVPGLGVWA